jgi:hypothetical protein
MKSLNISPLYCLTKTANGAIHKAVHTLFQGVSWFYGQSNFINVHQRSRALSRADLFATYRCITVLCARYHLVDPGVDGRIILRRIFGKWDVGVWTGMSWLRIEICGGHL